MMGFEWKPIESSIICSLVLGGIVFIVPFIDAYRTQILRRKEHKAVRIRYLQTLNKCILVGCAHLILSPFLFLIQVSSNRVGMKRMCLAALFTMTLFGPFAFNLVRIWLLWFEIKKNREQKSCIKFKLNRESTAFTTRCPSLGLPSFVTKLVFVYISVGAAIWFIVFWVTDDIATSSVIIYAFIAVAMCLNAFLVQQMYRMQCVGRKSFVRSFSDTWKVRAEMTSFVLLQVLVMIGITLHGVLPHSDTVVGPHSNTACMFYAIFMSLIGMGLLSTSLGFPILSMKEWDKVQKRFERASSSISKKLERKCSKNKMLRRNSTIAKIHEKISTVTLVSVFQEPRLFDLFSEHLSNELSIESLLFLIEVWQFKFADRASELHELADIVEHELHPQDDDSDSSNNVLSSEFAAVDLDDTKDDAKAKAKVDDVVYRYTPATRRRMELQSMLLKFNWTDLPLSDTVFATNNKAKQAVWIYDLYVSVEAFDRINICHSAHREITERVCAVCPSYQAQMGVRDKHRSSSMFGSFGRTLTFSGRQKDRTNRVSTFSETAFEAYDDEEIRTIFDRALWDVLDNLNDSMLRFKQGDHVLQYLVRTEKDIFSEDGSLQTNSTSSLRTADATIATSPKKIE